MAYTFLLKLLLPEKSDIKIVYTFFILRPISGQNIKVCYNGDKISVVFLERTFYSVVSSGPWGINCDYLV